MRDPITLICAECSSKNYRSTKNPSKQKRLELKKYCRLCRRHTLHKEQKK